MSSFMRSISITTRCAIQYRGERLAAIGLNGSHIEYILNICRTPGVTQDRLAQIIHVNGSNVTRQLTLLEDNGYVERRQSPADKRMIEVFPTPKATAALPFVRSVLQDWNDYLTADFTEAEKSCLASLLERVLQKAERYADGMAQPEGRPGQP